MKLRDDPFWLLWTIATLLIAVIATAGVVIEESIGVRAVTAIGDRMTVDVPVVNQNERLLLRIQSKHGTFKLHENGRIDSTLPHDEAASEFLRALVLIAALQETGPKICYPQGIAPDDGDRNL